VRSIGGFQEAKKLTVLTIIVQISASNKAKPNKVKNQKRLR
jgi:hypothetical protein